MAIANETRTSGAVTFEHHALSARRHSAAEVTCLVTVVELPAPLRTFRRCNAGFRGRRPRVADSARKID